MLSTKLPYIHHLLWSSWERGRCLFSMFSSSSHRNKDPVRLICPRSQSVFGNTRSSNVYSHSGALSFRRARGPNMGGTVVQGFTEKIGNGTWPQELCICLRERIHAMNRVMKDGKEQDMFLKWWDWFSWRECADKGGAREKPRERRLRGAVQTKLMRLPWFISQWEPTNDSEKGD